MTEEEGRWEAAKKSWKISIKYLAGKNMKKIILIIVVLLSSKYSSGQQIFSNDNYMVEVKQLGYVFADREEREYGWFDGGMTYLEATILNVHDCFFSKKIIVKGYVGEKDYEFSSYTVGFNFYTHGFIGKRNDKKVTFLRSFKINSNNGEFKVKIKPDKQIYFELIGSSTLELTVIKSSVPK
jgi:hypothetical protein